jgi:hypothetical protein
MIVNIKHYVKYFFRIFDRFEDSVRGTLSHVPIVYAFIGGTAVVLFWRAVWHTADIFEQVPGFIGWFFTPEVQLVAMSTVLLSTGVMVSTFIGDRIILSGLKHEKKIEEKTASEVRSEMTILSRIEERLTVIESKIAAAEDKEIDS